MCIRKYLRVYLHMVNVIYAFWAKDSFAILLSLPVAKQRTVALVQPKILSGFSTSSPSSKTVCHNFWVRSFWVFRPQLLLLFPIPSFLLLPTVISQRFFVDCAVAAAAADCGCSLGKGPSLHNANCEMQMSLQFVQLLGSFARFN